MNATPEAAAAPAWGLDGCLDDPSIRLLLWIVAGLLALAVAVVATLIATGRVTGTLRSELVARTASWLGIAPAVVVPVLAGRLPTTLLVLLLSLLCFREFARATGFAGDPLMSGLVVLAILATNFAAIDHAPGLFAAIPALSLVAITAAALLRDRPAGYLQRVGLASLAMLFFGLGLGHVSFMANEPSYRGPMLLLLLCAGLNDVFAYCVGKAVGGPKLAPHTSPGKTVAGAVGAVVLTTSMVLVVGPHVFRSDLRVPQHLLAIGLLVSCLGILGDLTMSSVKRDVGIKDMGAVIPGHGGVLDRCNSLLLAAPALFHYIGYFHGFGQGQPQRILTGP
jgi:phosphatidate cytidylyltransferase